MEHTHWSITIPNQNPKNKELESAQRACKAQGTNQFEDSLKGDDVWFSTARFALPQFVNFTRGFLQ